MVRKNCLPCFVAFMFSFSYHQCDNLALLLNFSGDDSELHVIIFDEIDAICKVICFIQAVVNFDNYNLRQSCFVECNINRSI